MLLAEIHKHPRSKVNDIYKFLHQAAFGSEHAIKDTSSARNWLEEEIAGLGSYSNDALIDTLSPDGRLVRINLSRYLKEGFSPKELLNAFIKTANNYNRSIEKFRSYWESALELVSTKKLPFTEKEMDIIFGEQAKENFPAIHHSKEYTSEYKPAYRVVDLTYLPILRK